MVQRVGSVFALLLFGAVAQAAEVPPVELTLELTSGEVKEHIVRAAHGVATATIANCVGGAVDSSFTIRWVSNKVGRMESLELEASTWTDAQRTCVEAELGGRLMLLPAKKRSAEGTITGVTRTDDTRCAKGDGVACTGGSVEAATALSRACDEGGAQACSLLGDRRTAGLPADEDRAMALAATGCELHNPRACDLALEPGQHASRPNLTTVYVSLPFGALEDLTSSGASSVGDLSTYRARVGGVSVFVAGQMETSLLVCDGPCDADARSHGAIDGMFARCAGHDRVVVMVGPDTPISTVTWVVQRLAGENHDRHPQPIVMEGL